MLAGAEQRVGVHLKTSMDELFKGGAAQASSAELKGIGAESRIGGVAPRAAAGAAPRAEAGAAAGARKGPQRGGAKTAETVRKVAGEGVNPAPPGKVGLWTVSWRERSGNWRS